MNIQVNDSWYDSNWKQDIEPTETQIIMWGEVYIEEKNNSRSCRSDGGIL